MKPPHGGAREHYQLRGDTGIRYPERKNGGSKTSPALLRQVLYRHCLLSGLLLAGSFLIGFQKAHRANANRVSGKVRQVTEVS